MKTLAVVSMRSSDLGSVHPDLLAIALAWAMPKMVEYQFLAMTTNANTIAKSVVWTDPKDPFTLSS